MDYYDCLNTIIVRSTTRRLVVLVLAMTQLVWVHSAFSEMEKPMANVVRETGARFEINYVRHEIHSILMGKGCPIAYRAQVQPGSEYVVVLGFYEDNYRTVGNRVMELNVEGGKPIRLDMAERADWKQALAVPIEGRDADRDGWLKIAVGPAVEAKDRNPTVAILWVFDRQDWSSAGMTAETVMKGKFDDRAYYLVNCGTKESLYPTLAFDKRMTPMRALAAGLASVCANHKEVYHSLDKNLMAKVKSDLAALEKKLQANQIRALAVGLRDYEKMIDSMRRQAESILVARYKPALRKPAETRLSSPWGALACCRQEDKLRLNLSLLPKPLSLKHSYHPAYATREPLGIVEVAAQTPARKASTDLGLQYDLALRDVEYDPLETRYHYADGEVDIQVMDKAALRIVPKSLRLMVGLDPALIRNDPDLLYGVADSLDGAQIFCGVVFKGVSADEARKQFDRGGVVCEGMTLCWADSLEDLKRLAAEMKDWHASQRAADQWIRKQTRAIKLEGDPELVKRAATDKRTFLSMQHQFGGIFAALDGGYNAIWVRDSTIVALCTALAGDPQFLKRWTPYLLANPTPVEARGKKYKTFIIAPYDGHEVFRLEDDGPFYAIASAYAYWKLIGDDSLLKEWYATLQGAVDYLKAESYQPELGLYSESLINEAALKASSYWQNEKLPGLKVGDDWPMRICSLYINNLMYAGHLMLGEMGLALGETARSAEDFKMAEVLAERVENKLWNPAQNVYLSGIAMMENGRKVPLDWNYYDIFIDYVWAFSLFPQTPNAFKSYRSMDTMLNSWDGPFPVKNGRVYTAMTLGHAAYVYAWADSFDKATQCLRSLDRISQQVKWNDEMNAIYMMRGAMIELTTHVQFHRPQVFVAGPCLNGVVALGVALDFNGVSIIPSGLLTKADHIIFKNVELNVDLCGAKNVAGLVVDGQRIPNTLRIPSSFLTPGKHEVKLLDQAQAAAEPLLRYSNLELVALTRSATGGLDYQVEGHGRGLLRFMNLKAEKVCVTDAAGAPLDFEAKAFEGSLWVMVKTTGETIHVRVN